MGYTTNEINEYFNSLVDSYKLAGYREVPCSNVCYLSNILRSIDLSCTINNNSTTLRLSLCSCMLDRSKEFNHQIQYYDIFLESIVNFKHEFIRNICRFYRINDDYFVTDIDDAKRAISIWYSRSLNSATSSANHCITYNKMSSNVKNYIANKVNSVMDRLNRTHDYTINSVYFSDNHRKFVVTIKHSDSNKTEPLYFKCK